jgi:predicted RNA-binding Zn ribbon-like protein
VTSPMLVVALANARARRRPPRAARASVHDALKDANSASELLEPFLGQPVDPADLSALCTLHHAVVRVVDALIDGTPPPLDAINEQAVRVPATYALAPGSSGAELRAVLSPRRNAAVGKLVLEVVRELAELDSSRLRRCARPECRLVFYDATRSATQRWHAESPCGLRERQLRYRAARAGGAGPAAPPPPGRRGRSGDPGVAR